MAGGTPLSGKVALVTGASRGVGKAIALELADLGAEIVVTARTVSPRFDIAGTIVQTVSDIEARGSSATCIQADLLVEEDVQRLAADTLERFGTVDILVNNAAFIGDEVFQSFWEMSTGAWREQFDLNVNAEFALMKHFAPGMRQRGQGLIVNLGSNDGNVPDGELPLPRKGGLGPSYPTTKAAIVHMTKWVGNELPRRWHNRRVPRAGLRSKRERRAVELEARDRCRHGSASSGGGEGGRVPGHLQRPTSIWREVSRVRRAASRGGHPDPRVDGVGIDRGGRRCDQCP